MNMYNVSVTSSTISGNYVQTVSIQKYVPLLKKKLEHKQFKYHHYFYKFLSLCTVRSKYTTMSLFKSKTFCTQTFRTVP